VAGRAARTLAAAGRASADARTLCTPEAPRPRGPPTLWPKPNALADCGWGRILFAQTYEDVSQLVSDIHAEGPEQRDIAMYVTDPHVLIASAPAELFSSPSHTD
jgi:hypothetical protein